MVRGMYLTKVEKDVIYKKYVSLGLSSIESNNRLKLILNHLEELKKKLLKNKKLTDEEKNQRFKEEFEKLCQKTEV